uniref:RNA polymerase subunit alpha n=1 Tax=Euglena undulata TaxID=1685799 RepID=UPI0023AA317C|nr:RNA polymerase subunit alpha [Euglena undulata]WCH63444.1 RNA polymerase subunit alpha [Euglena undulata]
MHYLNLFRIIFFNFLLRIKIIILYFIVCLKVADLVFLISRNAGKLSLYHPIHEFFELEEIKEDMLSVYYNLRQIKFKSNVDVKNRFFVVLNVSQYGEVFARNLLVPKNLSILNLDHYLFKFISSKIKVKVILKLDFCI